MFGWWRDTVVRNRPGVKTDRHGNKVPDWSDGVRQDKTIAGCFVQGGQSQEILGGRDAVVTAWTVYAAAGVDVTATDEITWQGVRYPINGAPTRIQSPTGALSHTVIELRAVDG